MALTPGSTRAAAADPYLAFNFVVEVDGVLSGGFSEVTGLGVQVDTTDYREGGVNEYVHKIAGPASYPSNLVLRRGLTDSQLLWRWHEAAREGLILRTPAVIMLLDSERNPAWLWVFRDAYPVRWTGPELRAASATVAIETLEIAHRGLLPLVSGPVG
jgi:phage tail-like protein